MGQFYGYEVVTSLYRYSTTQVRLPGGFSLKVGGQGYSSTSEITCDISVSGKGGIDTGSVAAGKVYYVYAVYSSGSFGLVASLSSTSPTGFTLYKKVGVFSTNSIAQISTTVYDYNALGSESVLNTKGYLRNNTLLSSSDFPDTSGLYTWPLNGVSSFSGSNSYGGSDLTLSGTAPTTGANHLGSTVYNTVDGTKGFYVNNTNFDASNESFTIGGWFKQTATTGAQNLIAKNPSFYFYALSGNLVLNIYYGVASLIGTSIPSPLLDGQYHHIVAVYNQATTSVMFVVDGKIVAYNKDSNLAARYNASGGYLTYSGYYTTSLTNPFIGSVADVFYKKSAMTFDQVRQLYVTGTKLQAYLDLANKVKINGETGPFGWQEFTGLNISTTSGSYTAATTQYLPVIGTYDFKAKIQQAANYVAANGLGGAARITLGGTTIDSKSTYWYDPASGAAVNYIQSTIVLSADKYPVNSTSSALVLDGNSAAGGSVHWNSSAVLRWELWNY